MAQTAVSDPAPAMSVPPAAQTVPVSPAAQTVSVAPARGPLRGTIRVSGDKSISHRAALFNAVAEGEAVIENYSPGADCASTLACLRQLGVAVERDESGRVRIQGVGLRGLVEPSDVLDCGNSGTSMRLL